MSPFKIPTLIMSSSIKVSLTWMAPFAAGVASTLFIHYSWSQFKNWNRKRPSLNENRSENNPTTEVAVTAQHKVFDSPTLDHRILRKAECALRKRTSRLILVIERCTNDHNYSAILRTAEALGVQHVWIISPQSMIQGLSTTDPQQVIDYDEEEKQSSQFTLYKSSGLPIPQATVSDLQDRAQHHLFAQKASEWLTIREFNTTAECIDALHDAQFTIWATDLSQVAIPLTPQDLLMHAAQSSSAASSSHGLLPNSLAIVFGTESVGCTQEVLQKADCRVYLPLHGFADSLNLSVAVALVIFQLFHLDPSLIGAMPEDERRNLRRHWYTKLAKQRILTSSQKQELKQLSGKIQRLEKLQRKMESNSTIFSEKQRLAILQDLEKMEEWKLQRKTLEEEVDVASSQAIEHWVKNPPEPLDDMRRADEHRLTYISKNWKKRNEEIWANMPAVQYIDTRIHSNKTSDLFRPRKN